MLVAFGIAFLLPRILQLKEEPIWLAAIGDILGLITILAGLILSSLNKNNNRGREHIVDSLTPDDFPYYILHTIADITNILLPDPSGEASIPDREIPYLPRHFNEDLKRVFAETGRILVRGRSKTGKSRSIVELLREQLKTDPTILILKRTSELQDHLSINSGVPRRNLIIVIDDLHIHGMLCKRNKLNVEAILNNTIQQFIAHCGNQASEVRVILGIRKEPECWSQIDYDPSVSPWSEITLVDAPDISAQETESLIIELANKIQTLRLTKPVIDTLAKHNDGTYYRIVLAFREWKENKKEGEITLEDTKNLQSNLASAWKYRQSVIFRIMPLVKSVYAALELLQNIGIPTQKDVVCIFAQAMDSSFITRLFSRIYRIKLRWKKNSERIFSIFANVMLIIDTLLKRGASKAYMLIERGTNKIFFRKSHYYRSLKTKHRLLTMFYFLEAGIIFITTEILVIDIIFGLLDSIIDGFIFITTHQIIVVCLGLLLLLVLAIVWGAEFLFIRENIRFKNIIDFVAATEIPVVDNALTPYDLQVQGNLGSIQSNHDWISSLMDKEKPEFFHEQAWSIMRYSIQDLPLNLSTNAFGVLLDKIILQLNGKDVDNLLSVANIYLWSGKYSEAMERISRAIEFESKNVSLFYQRRSINHLLGNFEHALLDIDMAARIAPYQRENNSSILTETLIAAGRPVDALNNCNLAIEINPQNDWGLFERYCIYHQKGDNRKAALDLEEALFISELNKETYARNKIHEFNYALYILATGEYDKAENLYSEALKDNPLETYIRFALIDLNIYTDLFPETKSEKTFLSIRDQLESRFSSAPALDTSAAKDS
jgi:tetratricopeptide (TPR) repeat protein